MQLELNQTRIDQEFEIEQITEQLSQMFKQAESSGEIAWRIGEMLRDIKSKRSYKRIANRSYASFNDYVRKELDKTEETVNNYIKIRQSFETPEEISKMLVSHLRELVNIKDERVRKLALKVFRDLEKKYKSGNPTKRWSGFSTKDVKTAVNLFKEDQNIQEHDIKKIVQHVKSISTRRVNKKRADKHGEELTSKKFPHIPQIFKYRPIDEMGVVALFCVLFETLRKHTFTFALENKQVKLSFQNIRYARTAFPDVSLSCKIMDGKGRVVDLFAELEYKSGNYIQHQHFLSDAPCDMIICWENNIDRTASPWKDVKRLPPIFSLGQFLREGTIKFV